MDPLRGPSAAHPAVSAIIASQSRNHQYTGREMAITFHALRTAVVVAALMLVQLVGDAFACSCVSSGPPCQAAFTADVAFVGTVRSIKSIEPIPPNPGQVSMIRKSVIFDSVEGLLNIAGRTLEVGTGAGGGDCGYRFTVGQRYLVYAWKSDSGALTTGICSRTALFEKAREDIDYLRSMPATGSGGRVFGLISEWRRQPGEYGAINGGPLAGMHVIVQGANFQRDVLSDANGRFEVTGLPIGRTSVEVVAPFGYDTRHLTREIEISDLRACSEVEFRLALRATASGLVVDDSGRPVVGVRIDAVPAELAGSDPPPRHSVTTDERGGFAFGDLAPGRYVFGINLTVLPRSRRPGPSVFLPGVSKSTDATVIELSAGDEKDVGILRLPPR